MHDSVVTVAGPLCFLGGEELLSSAAAALHAGL